jgi:hypothetical protein
MRHADPHPAVQQMKLTDVMAAVSDPIWVGLVRLLAEASNEAGRTARAGGQIHAQPSAKPRCSMPSTPSLLSTTDLVVSVLPKPLGRPASSRRTSLDG